MGKIVGYTVAILMLVGTVGCASASAQAQTRGGAPGRGPGGEIAKPVTAAPATESKLNLSLPYTGTLEAGSQVNVVPQVSGRLDKLLVDVGSQVKAGDTIAVLQQDTLQLAVQQARANLSSAQAKLATVMAGGRPESIASAQAALDAANVKLDQLKNPSPASVQAAQTALIAAQADLASNQAALARVQAGPTQDVIAAAQASVDSDKSALKSAQDNQAQLKNPTAAAIAAAQVALDNAQQAMATAEDNYQMAQNGNLAASKATSNSAAYDAYVAAKSAYDAAQQNLSALQNPTPAAMQAAQTQVDQAQNNYNAAVAKLNVLKATPTQQDLQQAQAAVNKSQATVASAQAALDQLQHPTARDIQLAQDAVNQAQQALALQQKPYTAQDVQSARAAVDQAQAALDSAKVQLGYATIVAPFDGVITQKFVSPGALVSPSTPIVALNGSDLDVPVSFEESRLPMLKAGLDATLTVTAFPGQTFEAKVADVYPSADPKTHTFIMKIIPSDPKGELRAGMFASVVVKPAPIDNAIMIPLSAVSQVNGKDVVFVVVDGKAQARPVVQGALSGADVQIVSGLKPGDSVVVSGNVGLNDGDAVRVITPTSAKPSGTPGSGKPSGTPGSSGGQGGQPQSQGGQSGQPKPQGTSEPTKKP